MRGKMKELLGKVICRTRIKIVEAVLERSSAIHVVVYAVR